ncbi:MAG: DUF1015 domain-containing protein [Lachnospiraceae bacterium]|nr:DUF1015 domain-containing protein [Lachnospiraceae bacterium]
MAEIRAFAAYRPAEGMAERIAALPYDVYNRAEAKAVVEKNPDSFLAIDRAETSFDDSVDTYADEVYAKASSMLWERIEKGDFVKEAAPCYYLYELTMNGRVQSGIVGCASIDDYESGVIKKHENTRADKEADRIRHVDSCNAQTGPIFLAYRQTEALRSLMNRTRENAALYDFTADDGIRHRVFVIDKAEDIALVHDEFGMMNALYIADGHHRCASAVRVGQKRRAENPAHTGEEEYNYFLSVIFPDEELMIMDYNRLLLDLNGRSADELKEELKKLFELSESDGQYHPACKGELGMYLAGKWYRLSMKEELKSDDPVEGLDVAILQKQVLDPLFGIKDPKTDKRIEFIGGIRGLNELERRVNGLPQPGVAFAMFPTSITELFAVADAGKLMPPKSTWFEPKLRSGLFIHAIGGSPE